MIIIWLLLYYIYPFLDLNYSELNPVKSPIGKGKSWRLLPNLFFLPTVRNSAEASN